MNAIAPGTSLIERLEGSEVGSRVLDATLCRRFDLPVCFEPDCLPDVFERCIQRVEGGGEDSDVPHYTTSLNAALALVERVQPEVRPSLAKARAPGGRGDLWRANLTEDDGRGMYGAWAKTPALALCIALLKATQHDDGIEHLKKPIGVEA